MKLTLESTPHVLTVDGVKCRLWRGTTENGAQVVAFIHRLAFEASALPDEMVRELVEVHAPHVTMAADPLAVVLGGVLEEARPTAGFDPRRN